MSSKCLLTFDFGRLRIALFEDIFTTEDWAAKQEEEHSWKKEYFHFPETNHNICKSKQSKKGIREPFNCCLADFVRKFSNSILGSKTIFALLDKA